MLARNARSALITRRSKTGRNRSNEERMNREMVSLASSVRLRNEYEGNRVQNEEGTRYIVDHSRSRNRTRVSVTGEKDIPNNLSSRHRYVCRRSKGTAYSPLGSCSENPGRRLNGWLMYAEGLPLMS